jgi:hypothetical protein
MRFSTPAAMATSVARRPSVRERSASPTTRFQRETSASMVCPRSRKRRVFPLRAGRDDVADLDDAVGDDHAVYQQLEQGPLPLEIRGDQALPHTPAECLRVHRQLACLVLLPAVAHEVLLLAV